MGQVVLVTGVSRHLGGRFADLLLDQPGVDHVVGVDVVAPASPLRAEFVRADIRHPAVARVLEQHHIDTVAHLAVIATPTSAGGRVAMKEINVLGTMHLLAAVQSAPAVRRLVVKSSAAVYGSSPRDPALFTEETSAKALPHSGFGKDSLEVEGYVRGLARRRPDVAVTLLRFANVLGPRISTAMTEYFSLPVVPTVLGFDPRLQFVHEDDALAALLKATVGGLGGAREGAGAVNIAADGVLTLTQAARMAGRPTLPVLRAAGGWVGQVSRRLGVADLSPDQLQFLAHGRVLDTTRMREVLGFEPAFSTRAAFADFVAAGRGSAPFGATLGAVADDAERVVLEALGRSRAAS